MSLNSKRRYAMFPEAYKAGVLASQIPTSTVGDFDVVRPTSVDRINKDGQVESVAPNVPVLDYSDGGCPKLLTGADDEITNAGDSSTFNSESGVLFADVKIQTEDFSGAFIIETTLNGDNFLGILGSLGNSRFRYKIGGTTTDIQSNVADLLMQNKFALVYLNNEMKAYINGIEVGSTPILNYNSNILSELRLSSWNDTQELIGKTKSIQHFDALTDQELEELTGYDSYDQMVNQFNFTTL